MSNDSFDWYDDKSVVIPQVDAVAVYSNDKGDIVIRQQNSHDDDSIIVVPKVHAMALIASIRNELSPDNEQTE